MAEERIPPFYKRYLSLVVNAPLITHFLEENGKAMYHYAASWDDEMTNYRYAPDKWSAREVIQHLIDAERIFSYRALRFARKDQTELPGYDENAYAATYKEDQRPFGDLLEDMRLVRAATIHLFNGFTAVQLRRSGTASGAVMTVKTLGEVIAGHELHHRKILMERYFPD